MLPGIRQFLKKLTNSVFTTNVVLATVGLIVPIAANEKQRLRFWVPVSVGATGGIRTQLIVPAGGVSFVASILIVDAVASTQLGILQVASAVFVGPLANAGNHWIEVIAVIENGATDGNIDLQFAQDTSDALSATVLAGAFVEVLKY